MNKNFDAVMVHHDTRAKLEQLATLLTRRQPDKKKVKLCEAAELAIGNELRKQKRRKPCT